MINDLLRHTQVVYVALVFLTVLLNLVISIYAWQRIHVAGSRALAVLMFAAAGYSFAYTMQISSTTLEGMVMWYGILLPFASMISPAWFIFILRITGNDRWMNNGYRALFVVIPLLTCLVYWLPYTRQWYGSGFGIDATTLVASMMWVKGWMYYINLSYSYLLIIGGMVVLVLTITRMRHIFQAQMVAVLIGATIPLAANIMFHTGNSPVPGLDVTPLTFPLTGIAWGLAVFRYRLLDLIPVGHDTVVDMIDTGLVIVDDRSRILDYNLAATRIFGWKKQDQKGKQLRDTVPAEALEIIEQQSEDEKTVEVQWGLGEEQRWLRIKVHALLDIGRRLSGRLILLEDISVDKESQAAVTDSEYQLRSMIDQSNDGIFLADKEGRVLAWNLAQERFTGVLREEALGKPVWSVYGTMEIEMLNGLPPRQYIKESVIDRGRHLSENWTNQEVELVTRDRDGQLRYFQSVLFPIHTSQGVLLGGINREITERRRAEMELLEKQKRLDTIMNSVRAGIITVDATTRRIVDINPAALEAIGATYDEVIGSECIQFLCAGEKGRCPILDYGRQGDSSEQMLCNIRGQLSPVMRTVTQAVFNNRRYIIESFVHIHQTN